MAYNHPFEVPSSLGQGELVGFGVAVVLSCVEDFHVSLGDSESFGSFGRAEFAIVACKNLRVAFAEVERTRAMQKNDATAVALEQQQRKNSLALFWNV